MCALTPICGIAPPVHPWVRLPSLLAGWGWLGLVRAGWTGLAGWIWGLAGALLVDYLFLFRSTLLVKEKISDPKTPDAESVVLFLVLTYL